jgi:hypothetical protein
MDGRMRPVACGIGLKQTVSSTDVVATVLRRRFKPRSDLDSIIGLVVLAGEDSPNVRQSLFE